MNQIITFTGELRTLEQFPAHGYREFITEVSGRSIETIVAEQFQNGGNITVKMRAHADTHLIEFMGPITVIAKKRIEQYFENGWLIASEEHILTYRVNINNIPLSTRIAEYFEHPTKRQYYDRGWWTLSFACYESSVSGI